MPSTSYGVGQYATSEAHCFVLPKAYTGGGRGTVYGHGYSSNATEPFLAPAADVCNRFADWVGPLLVTDLGGGSTWANDTAMARAADARNFFISTYGVQSKVNLFGGSMGAANMLMFAKNNPTLVNAIGLVIPVVSISDIHDNNRAGYASVIEACYGSLGAWNAAKATHDPGLQADNSWAGIPMKVWASSTDPICVPAAVSAFVARTGCEFQDLGTGGHDAQPIVMSQVAAFFGAHP